jgi:NADH dehydrogenase FAD-containing subunit/uncharacterized membrane protein YphA (DoxX/SURF4 family)
MAFQSYWRGIFLALLLFIAAVPALAHEGWILTPAEMLEWNSKPKPALFTQWSTTNVIVLGSALLFALIWVRIGFTGAREMFPDLQARLASYGEYSAIILRFCLAWVLLASAFALEPRVGNSLFQSPTLIAPDLELRLLGPDWMWLREAQILLGLMFLFGIYVRFAAIVLMVVSVLGLFLFGRDMVTYFTAVLGVGVYLLLQGPGSRYVPLPVPQLFRGLVDRLAAVPRQRAQFLLRILAGLNFLYLGVYFKVLQPNLALGIIETYQVPILSGAPEFFVLLMAVVETFAGIFLLMGVLMRPMSIFLLAAFIFFASFLEESFTAHMLFYGVMLTFLFNAAGHWRRPEAKDKAASILILGGGFAAVRAAMRLEKLRGPYTHIDVTLVTPHSEFVFGPMLPEVVGGSIQPANIVNPIRRILSASRVIEGSVQSIDAEQRVLTLKRASGNEMTLAYDELILAQQAEPDFNGVAGLAQHGLPIDSIGDALYLRQWVLKKLAEAEHLPSSEARQGLLTFAVLGGGERGCGTAMEIRRLLQTAASAYPSLDRGEFKVALFEDPEDPRQRPPADLVDARNRLLARSGIELRNESTIASITAAAIHLNDDSVLPCSTPVNARFQLPENLLGGAVRGWLESDGRLRLEGQDRIWLAGDNSGLLRGRHAGHGARYHLGEKVAYNAWAHSQKYRLFEYRPPRKWMQTFHMGRYSVGKLGPVVFSGLLAWFISRVSCLNALPGLERNLRIVIDWILDIPFRNDIAVLTPDRTERLSQAYFHPGDELMREGESGDTAFIIQSGTVGVYQGEKRVAQRGRGDILGELALIHDAPRTATIRCDTEVAVTCLNRGQFMELMGGFSVFGDAIRQHTRLYEDRQLLDATTKV